MRSPGDGIVRPASLRQGAGRRSVSAGVILLAILLLQLVIVGAVLWRHPGVLDLPGG